MSGVKFGIFRECFFLVILLIPLGCASDSRLPVSPLASPLRIVSPLPSAQVIPIRIDRPIHAGTTRVTGSGPKGIPVVLIDITSGGAWLASDVINEDGKFEFRLTKPLEARHRIGVALGDLSGTGMQVEDFSHEGYNGDEPLNIPQVGFFFDTYVISE